MRLLVERGARLDLQDAGGRTALHWCAVTRSSKCVQALCKAAASSLQQAQLLNCSDHDQLTPLVRNGVDTDVLSS